MQRLANSTPSQVHPGIGVSGEGRGRNTRGSRRNEAILEIAADALPDSAVRGLVDEWLVPMIVERIIEDRVQPERGSLSSALT